MIYIGSTSTDDESVTEMEAAQRHSTVVVTDHNSGHSTSDEKNVDNSQEHREEDVMNDPHSI